MKRANDRTVAIVGRMRPEHGERIAVPSRRESGKRGVQRCGVSDWHI